MDDRLMVFAGPASARLGAEVCETLHVAPAAYECRRFPDGEMHIEIQESVRARDVFVLQSTSPPVEQHLMELLLIADACRRAGAARLTAVIPYLGYARQDRRTRRQSLGARVMADVIGTAGFDRLMLVDAHTAAIEGFFAIPVEHLTAVPLLARAAAADGSRHLGRRRARPGGGQARPRVRAPAPGAGGRRLQDAPGWRRGGGPRSHRRGARQTATHRRRHVDHRGTLAAAIAALQAAGAVEPMTVAVTHAVLAGRAREILRTLPLTRLIATDTIALEPPDVPHLELTSVAPLLATAIRRDHRDESLADLRLP